MKDYDAIIIGGGAAGLMCAMTAAKRGRRVCLLEHNDRVGKKIRISGGGRANFTNLYSSNDNYLSQNSHFFKSAFKQYTPQNFIALVEKHQIQYHEKKLGQLFCDGSAQQIIDMLLKECETSGVETFLNCSVNDVVYDDAFHVQTSQGDFYSESVVIASGGLSIPKIGATDFGYRVAKKFGHPIISCLPALVPLTMNQEDLKSFQELSGVSLDSIVKCGKARFRENILFTHRGLSGPAILQISSYWNSGHSIEVDLMPDIIWADFLNEHQNSSQTIQQVLNQIFPKRFVSVWNNLYGSKKSLAQCSKQEWQGFEKNLKHWTIVPKGTEGYLKAEVTRGGVDTNELSSKTMESNKQKGLYFIGEVVDVTGHLGGHNFQWAWSSGYVAGQSI